jgi:RNA polymerase sigma factor (sigma-70 family)
VSTHSANPSLTFPLTGGKAVDTNKSDSPSANHVALLTRKLAARDEAAFREFHEQYFDRLYHFLLVVCRGQEPEAQDALQQTFLRVIRYIRPFETEDVFWCWLKTVARSAARDLNRKEKRYSAFLETLALRFLPAAQDNRSIEGDHLALALEESLAELSEPERHLLEAKYVKGSTVKELGAETGLTIKAIESRLERLRRAVRERVLKKISKNEKS